MKVISKNLLNELSEKAQQSERLRSHYNLHESLEEDIHRLCIAAEPGTYFRPHRHLGSNKWELFIVLNGQIDVLIFDDNGVLKHRYPLTCDGEYRCLELPKTTWHSFVSMAKGTVLMEVKRGPYVPPGSGDLAAWAPGEGGEEAVAMEKWFRNATVGEKYPQK